MSGERQSGAFANVVVLQALLELVQQPLTQGAIGIVHPLDGQGGEEPEQDGHRGGKDPLTLLGEARQLELVDPLVLEHLFLQPLQSRQGDGTIGPLFPLQHVAHGADGARAAEAALPAQLAVLVDDGGELVLGFQHGIVEGLLAQLAVGKEALGEADTPHLAAGERLVIEALADDELGAAAADVHHQYLALDVLGMGDPLIDETRLFLAADDLDGVVEHLGRLAHELAGVAGTAQGIGAGDADLIRLDVGQPLGKQGEAVEAPGHGFGRHAALAVHSLCQPHPLFYPIDDLQPSFGEAGDDHVKAVRAKIHGGVQAIVHCLTLCV